MPETLLAGFAGRPYHITWRSAAKRMLFREDRDRFVYLGLLRSTAARASLRFLGYTLMPDHVHLVAVADSPQALSTAVRHAHAAYSRYFHSTSGGLKRHPRCYICPLEEAQVEKAVAYIESNPVRAGLVPLPELYPWSSAAAHLQLARPYLPLASCPVAPRLGPRLWRQVLQESAVDYTFWKALRRETFARRPTGLSAAPDRVSSAPGSEPAAPQAWFDFEAPAASLAALAAAVGA